MIEYNPKYCEEVITHCTAGLSVTSFGGKLGISSKTLRKWKKDNPEFKEACDIAKAKSQLFHESQGVNIIKLKGDSKVWVFMQKAYFNKTDAPKDPVIDLLDHVEKLDKKQLQSLASILINKLEQHESK